MDIDLSTMNILTIPDSRESLPAWSKDYRAIPNALARSALFTVSRNGDRKLFRDEVIASTKDISLIYTGEELRQDDADVFLQVINIAKEQLIGEDIKFTAWSMILQLGWTKNAGSYARLKRSIGRMLDGTLSMVVSRPDDTNVYYAGHLISSFVYLEKLTDVQLSQWSVSLQREMVDLFAPDTFSLLHWPTRRTFSPTTKWLHSYYSTHKRPFPVKLETLRRIMASETKNFRAYKLNIKESLKILVETKFFLTAHVDPVTDLVHVERAADRRLLE